MGRALAYILFAIDVNCTVRPAVIMRCGLWSGIKRLQFTLGPSYNREMFVVIISSNRCECMQINHQLNVQCTPSDHVVGR